MKVYFLVLVSLLCFLNSGLVSANSEDSKIELECYWKASEFQKEEKEILIKAKRSSLPSGAMTTNGGGPRGAHWNPFHSLFCLSKTSLEANEIKEVTWTLNEKVVSVKSNTQSLAKGSLITVTFDQTLWEKQSRKMKKSDVSLVYQNRPEQLNAYKEYLKTKDQTLNGIPFVVGEVLLVKSIIKTEKTEQAVQGVIHAAFGE